MDKIKESKEKFHIEVLVVLKDVQQQHGLRHKDYHSYHQYVTRKLHRMRKSLNFPQGKGNRVTPKKLTKNMVTDSRFILVKLFEAERAWASAMHLKAEAQTQPRKVFHMRMRLSKAVQRSRELWELCKWDKCSEHPETDKCERCALCDMHTYVETQAYFYCMQASRFFELGEWAGAKAMYERAVREYSGLAGAVDEDRRPLYEARAEELRPLVRYCGANCGAPGDGGDVGAGLHLADGDMDHFDGLGRLQAFRREAEALTEVRWQGVVIPVRLDQVRLVLAALADADRRQAGMDRTAAIGLCDSVLRACAEALSAVRDDLKAAGLPLPVQGVGIALAELARPQQLHLYLQWVKVSRTVQRNLLLVEAAAASGSQCKPQSMARLYDTVVQGLQELAGLEGGQAGPGCGGGGLEARVAVYTALRCHHLGQAHALLGHHAEWAALLARTGRHVRTALLALEAARQDPSPLPEAAPVLTPDLGALEASMRALEEALEADLLACRAGQCLAVTLEGSRDQGPPAMDQAVLDRMDVYQEPPQATTASSSSWKGRVPPGRLIDSPPPFEAVPVKPVLFDLAFYEVQFPGLEDKVRPREAPGEGRGLTGLVRGWIWGSK